MRLVIPAVSVGAPVNVVVADKHVSGLQLVLDPQ